VKVSCPSCAAKYSIADEKVRNRLAKIRCRKCETTIVIDGKTDPPTIAAADALVGRSDEYTVDISDNDQRQMTVPQVVAAYNEGLVTAETYVWKDGMADWEPLANVPELNEALHRAAAEAAASVAPAVSIPPSATFTAAATSGASRDLFGVGSANVPRASTRGTGADLFGGIDRAGGETDLATSAHEPPAPQAVTGARNESSVLFSLSSLTGGSPEKAKPSSLSRDAGDDSGLIDLGALAAKSDAGAHDVIAASPLGMAGVSPLGAPLIGGSTAALGADGTPVRSSASNRNGLFIGGGIAFAALVAGAVILLKEPPPPAPGVISITTAIATAPAEVADPDQNKEKPSEEAKADEKKDEAEKKDEGTAKPGTSTGRRYTPRTSPKPESKPTETKTEPKSEPKTDKPAAPKKSNCNCKPGDLMCAMKCSAKK
jgi:predicted Zn finger-like uncharacterized protein